jgi:hypothetical protein
MLWRILTVIGGLTIVAVSLADYVGYPLTSGWKAAGFGVGLALALPGAIVMNRRRPK